MATIIRQRDLAPYLRQSILFLCIFLFFFSCAPPPKLMKSDTSSVLNQIPIADSTLTHQRSGTVSYMVDGQIYNGNLYMTWQGDGRCAFNVTGFFGISLLDLQTRGDTVIIAQGDRNALFSAKDPVSKIGFFEDYPFTFGEAIRIISGSYIRSLQGLGTPDSAFGLSDRQFLVWHHGQNDIRVRVAGSDRVPVEVEIVPLKGKKSEKVVLSGFKDGLAAQVVCFLDNENSFSVKYGHAKISK